MTNRLQIISLLLAVALLSALPLNAQQSDPVFRTDTRLVLLHASVVDRRGNLVTDLEQDAFTVLEDKREQPISLFRREDIPIRSEGVV